jgi:hypothetical protein
MESVLANDKRECCKSSLELPHVLALASFYVLGDTDVIQMYLASSTWRTHEGAGSFSDLLDLDGKINELDPGVDREIESQQAILN